MASVLCPTIAMAVERGTPARSRFLTAVRRKSWGIRPGTPARRQAVFQARRKLLSGRPAWWKTHGMMAPASRWSPYVHHEAALDQHAAPYPHRRFWFHHVVLR